MATSLAIAKPDSEAIEKALIAGDLSKLTPEQRSAYYMRVCESVGLNPLTQPFSYIILNGKLTLYANRAATDQLRKVHGVSIHKIDKERMEDLYVVTAYARDASGREDSSTGAVVLGSLKGEALANAMMKAETKAKRRVTLSICGLGLLDETEVATIPTARQLEEGAAEYESQHQAVIDKVEAKPETKPNHPFALNGEKLWCWVFEVNSDKTSKGAEYLRITFHDATGRERSASCFDTKLFAAVKDSQHKQSGFVVEQKGQYINIVDVKRCGDLEYEGGLPVIRYDEPVKA